MKSTIYVLFAFLLLMGCSKNNITDPPSTSSGSVLFKIDKTTVPSNVATITLKLSRNGFQDIISTMNILTDTTAELTIPSIPIGVWHLKVDAKDSTNAVTYTGETDVSIQEDILLQLNLTLNPVLSGSGMGSVHVFVTWGTPEPLHPWVDYINNPVLNINSNPSNPYAIKTGAVLYDNGIYKMWYYCVYNAGVAKIWYAESPDGIAWTTIGIEPVLSPGYNTWDGYSIWVCSVLKEGNLYKMYYGGYENSWSGLPRVGIAVSSDGINWEKRPNPIFSGTGEFAYTYITSIVKIDSTYYAYVEYKGTYYGNAKIGYMTSVDGDNWSAVTPLFTATVPWENGGVNFPSVAFDGSKYHMTYSGKGQNAIGYARSIDGIVWEKQGSPILTNETASKSWITIAYPILINVNNELRVYYTGDNLPELYGFCLLKKEL